MTKRSLLALLLVAASCSAAPPNEATATPAPLSPFDSNSAIEMVRAVSEMTVQYMTEGVMTGDWDRAAIAEATQFFDSSLASLDVSAVHDCAARRAAATAATVLDVYELSYEGFLAYEVGPNLWTVAYRVVEVVPGVSDSTTDRAMYLTSNGIIGERSAGTATEGSCWNSAITRTDLGATLFASAADSDDGDLNPAADDIGAASSGPSTRAALRADPADPEPIRSTGSDKRDLLRVGDPSAFECLSYVGRGAEEILGPDKSSYEDISDAFLFVAHFSDGTSIDIRVHPEVGTLQEVTAEIAKYTTPLGQLPTVLRRDIARFAIRSGDETATASPLEGISMQTGNTAVRLADDRLEETIFHESVHTSLDPVYVYGTSTGWFDVQDMDGKFLTEYGRNNPTGEDLAETALYAYVLLHHPDRISAADAILFEERIPNRIAFIESLLAPDQPIFDSVGGPSPACESP